MEKMKTVVAEKKSSNMSNIDNVALFGILGLSALSRKAQNNQFFDVVLLYKCKSWAFDFWRRKIWNRGEIQY